MGNMIPPKEVGEYLYAIEEALNGLLDKQPDRMLVDVRVTWYGEPYAKLYKEGWALYGD